MRRRERITAAAGAVTLALSLFLVGGAFRWAQAIVAIAAASTVASQLPSRRELARSSPLLITIAVALGLTLVQLIPLPSAVLDWLQPIGSSLRNDSTDLFQLGSAHTLTLDVPGTLRAVCFLITLFAVAWTALRYAVTERGRFYLLAIVCGAIAMVGLTVAIHEIVGATELYGIYKPKATPSVLGPLLNENHLGGLMAVGTMLAIGLAMFRGQRSAIRAMWLVVAAINGAVAVSSQSRGATLALVGGALVTVGVRLAQRLVGEGPRRRSRASFLTTSLPIGIVAACAIIVVIYASAGAVSSQLERTSISDAADPTSKVAIWRSTTQLAEDAPWLGVGRGAFEPAFTRVHPRSAVYTFSYVENEYLQLLVDWGVVGAIAIGAGLIWFTVVASRRWRDGAVAAGALGALIAVALQSMVDFGIELLGLAVPVVVVAATLSYVPIREVRGRGLRVAFAARATLVLVLLGAAVLLFGSSTRSLAEDHEQIAGAQVTMDDIKETVDRHPLDYYAFARGAELLSTSRDPRAVQLLNHALRLHPTHPGLHHMAADMLLRAKRPDQAALEYAAAVRAAPGRSGLIREVVQRLPPTIAPRGFPTDLVLLDQVLMPLKEIKADDVAISWLERVLVEHPGRRDACDRLFKLISDTRDVRAAEIATRHCPDIAPEAKIAIAKILLVQKRYADAREILSDVESWTGHIDIKMEGWLTLCDSFETELKFDEAKHCLRRLDGSGNVTDERRKEILSRLDRISEAMRAKAAQEL